MNLYLEIATYDFLVGEIKRGYLETSTNGLSIKEACHIKDCYVYPMLNHEKADSMA